MNSLRTTGDFAELKDLCKLSNAIQIDSRSICSVASFVRRAITLREICLGEASVRGRQCVFLLAIGAAV